MEDIYNIFIPTYISSLSSSPLIQSNILELYLESLQDAHTKDLKKYENSSDICLLSLNDYYQYQYDIYNSTYEAHKTYHSSNESIETLRNTLDNRKNNAIKEERNNRIVKNLTTNTINKLIMKVMVKITIKSVVNELNKSSLNAYDDIIMNIVGNIIVCYVYIFNRLHYLLRIVNVC